MSERHSDGFGKFLFGLVFGLATGFVVGILNADRPGRELRRDIEINSSDFLEGVRDRLDDLKEQATDTIRDFRGFTDERLKASAQNIQDQVDSLGKQLDELTQKQGTSFSERN